MLQLETLPRELAGLLAAFRGCFSRPTFHTFVSLVAGMIAQPGRRTVTGMMVAAGVSRVWHHSRGHRFFSRAKWEVSTLSVVAVKLVVSRLLPADADIELVLDDTLFRRSGRKVHAARWQHDGSARTGGPGGKKLGFGNGWVVAAVNVRLEFLDRVIGLPVGFALWGEPPKGRKARRGNSKPGADNGPSKTDLARDLVVRVAEAFPLRKVHVIADTFYAGLAGTATRRGGVKRPPLPSNVTFTSHPRSDVTFTAINKPVRGAMGRPRIRGKSMGHVADIAATANYRPTTVTRYATTATTKVAAYTCLWTSVYLLQPIRLILVLDDAPDAKPYAIITTDLDSSPAQIIARYANRWSIELDFHDAKNTTGVGQAHNRTPQAVRRTVPFGLIVQTLVIVWYALYGHTPDTVEQRRQLAPWYLTKKTPAYHDMLVKLRRHLIIARFRATTPQQRTPEEVGALIASLADAA